MSSRPCSDFQCLYTGVRSGSSEPARATEYGEPCGGRTEYSLARSRYAVVYDMVASERASEVNGFGCASVCMDIMSAEAAAGGRPTHTKSETVRKEHYDIYILEGQKRVTKTKCGREGPQSKRLEKNERAGVGCGNRTSVRSKCKRPCLWKQATDVAMNRGVYALLDLSAVRREQSHVN